MAKVKNGKKTNLRNNVDVRAASAGLINYCIPDILSRCGAGTHWEVQKRCKFAKKSLIGNRCMYYIESLDGHCDCVEAQSDQREKVSPSNQLSDE